MRSYEKTYDRRAIFTIFVFLWALLFLLLPSNTLSRSCPPRCAPGHEMVKDIRGCYCQRTNKLSDIDYSKIPKGPGISCNKKRCPRKNGRHGRLIVEGNSCYCKYPMTLDELTPYKKGKSGPRSSTTSNSTAPKGVNSKTHSSTTSGSTGSGSTGSKGVNNSLPRACKKKCAPGHEMVKDIRGCYCQRTNKLSDIDYSKIPKGPGISCNKKRCPRKNGRHGRLIVEGNSCYCKYPMTLDELEPYKKGSSKFYHSTPSGM